MLEENTQGCPLASVFTCTHMGIHTYKIKGKEHAPIRGASFLLTESPLWGSLVEVKNS